jgi:Spy/CpxP family protein refolding chaperone
MKKALIATVAIALLAAGAAIAQMPQQQPPRPGAALAAYLQLTPDQIATWQQIAKDTAAAVKPLADNEQQLRKQVQTALQAATPDPAAVGKLVVAADALRDQIRTLREAAKAKRLAVLTPDQKVKSDAFEAAVTFLRQQRRPRPNA